MSREDVNVYEAADKAIQAMNRQNVEAFGRLKMAKWEEVNVIRTVMAVYRKSARQARKKYRKVAYDAYMLGWLLCGLDEREGREAAGKAVTEKWVDRILSETDFVTLYRFDTEMERKAYRLAETLEVSPNPGLEIDKALRYWSQQLAQYAINVTDYAMVQAYEDAGVEKVMWMSQRDGRVCGTCHERDGQKYWLDEIPTKHPNCRCYLVPVQNSRF